MEYNPPDGEIEHNPWEDYGEEWVEIDVAWANKNLPEIEDIEFMQRMEEQHSSFKALLNYYLHELGEPKKGNQKALWQKYTS